MTLLAKQFFKKSVEREYYALVWGDVKDDEGVINAPIGRNPKNRLQMIVYEDMEGGKEAITNYKVIERFGYVTLVSCRLQTGRTHQIRVHMKYIGHTLFNDERYGGNKILKGTVYTKYKQFVDNCLRLLPRQALHAKTLGFIHPKTKEKLSFNSEIPDDITSVIDKWRLYSKHKNL
jgi:23S rRNA pseudouridine1911/1915/1917 synthase